MLRVLWHVVNVSTTAFLEPYYGMSHVSSKLMHDDSLWAVDNSGLCSKRTSHQGTAKALEPASHMQSLACILWAIDSDCGCKTAQVTYQLHMPSKPPGDKLHPSWYFPVTSTAQQREVSAGGKLGSACPAKDIGKRPPFISTLRLCYHSNGVHIKTPKNYKSIHPEAHV